MDNNVQPIKFVLKRIVNDITDEDENSYNQIEYYLVSYNVEDFDDLIEISDIDPAEFDWEYQLFEFTYKYGSSKLLDKKSAENIEIDDSEEIEHDNFLFEKLEEIFENDIKEYGEELKNIVDIEKIKYSALNYINNKL